MHALGDDSQLSSIHCRRFKGGWIYRRKTSLPSVSDRLWNAFRNNEDRPPSTTFFSLPYFLFIWPPSLRWAFIYCLIYRHPPPAALRIYILSPSNLILKYGDAGRNSLGLGRWRFMQRSLKPLPANYQYAISMGRLSPLILMNFRFICLVVCDMYREGENEEQ